MTPTEINDLLDAVAGILLRCTVFGFLLLLFWFAAHMLAGDLVYSIHADMFDLSRQQLVAIHYCGMGLMKLCVGLFFLLPYIAIRMVLKKRSAAVGK